MDWALLLVSSLTGVAVLFSYALVLADLWGAYPLPSSVDVSTSYFDSPYWLGLPKSTTIAVAFFHFLAVVGYVMWAYWIVQAKPIDNSILSARPTTIAIVEGFLVASILWPFVAYYHIVRPSLASALAACVPLWIAAICVVLLVGGTFEAMAPPYAVVGILWLGTVVVLADGVGWCAVCIKRVV